MIHCKDYGEVTSAWSDNTIYDRGHRFSFLFKRKPNTFDQIVSILQKEFSEVIFHDGRSINRKSLLIHKDFTIELYLFSDLEVHANSDSLLFNIASLIKDYVYTTSGEEINITYYYHHHSKGLLNALAHMDPKQVSTIYPELYSEIDAPRLIEAFGASFDPILILFGLPGTGKTTFIKLLFQSGKYKRVAYIKDNETLRSPELWPNLIEENFDLIVLDDLDAMLQPREDGKDSKEFLNQLLSFSNGIFTHKTKIVITTNVKLERIDAAIIRPGRCFDFLVIEPLTYEAARSFWLDKLGACGILFDSLFPEKGPIPQATLMSNYLHYVESKIDRSYNKLSKHYTVLDKIKDLGIKVGDEKRKAGF